MSTVFVHNQTILPGGASKKNIQSFYSNVSHSLGGCNLSRLPFDCSREFLLTISEYNNNVSSIPLKIEMKRVFQAGRYLPFVTLSSHCFYLLTGIDVMGLGVADIDTSCDLMIQEDYWENIKAN